MKTVRSADLLSTTNAKTSKGEKLGYLTGVLYMAPHKIATANDAQKHNLCPLADAAGCANACLFTAGRGVYNSVQSSRINKALLFIHRRDEFMHLIADGIRSVERKARRENLTPLIRLNGTTDILFERIPVTIDGTEYPNIFAVFPHVQFYDYTKIAARFARDIPSNYDLTFSYSGTPEYAPHVSRAVAYGARIAVVFRNRENLPASFLGLPVINGDDTDVRHIEPRAHIVALYAKGRAKNDPSLFIVNN